LSVKPSKRLIDFQDVYLEVYDNKRVTATVAVIVFGRPLELNVITKIEPVSTEVSDPYGTHLIETFDKLMLGGMELPTPRKWKSCRMLEITYLDDDMMIARTAGGEPHLLLRHSVCATNDDTCDIDEELTHTEYLKLARAKYGPTLTRSLVDRDFMADNDSTTLDMAKIVQLIKAILFNKKKEEH
jgi:hypothetical protein